MNFIGTKTFNIQFTAHAKKISECMCMYVFVSVCFSLYLSLSLSLSHTHTHRKQMYTQDGGSKGTGKVFDQCTYCVHKMYDEGVFIHEGVLAVCQCGLLLLYICNSFEPLLCANKYIHHLFNPSDASGSVSFSEETTSRTALGNGLQKRNAANGRCTEDTHS